MSTFLSEQVFEEDSGITARRQTKLPTRNGEHNVIQKHCHTGNKTPSGSKPGETHFLSDNATFLGMVIEDAEERLGRESTGIAVSSKAPLKN
ncbi:MAG: hypothetical protein U0903_03290 [Planctomycetales bacterium]